MPNTIKSNLNIFSISAFVFWILSIVILSVLHASSSNLPPIAKGGAMDILFYLPIAAMTLPLGWFMTRKRQKPTWDNFGINKKSIVKDLVIGFGYMIIAQVILGNWLNLGLHFPGPREYKTGEFGAWNIAFWALIQFLVYVVIPYLYLKKDGFSLRKLIAGINFKRDLLIMFVFWVFDFFGVTFTASNFLTANPSEYWYSIPLSIFFNFFGAGLPVLFMIHVWIIPRISLLIQNQITVVMLGGLAYTCISLFDPGVDYSNLNSTFITLSYLVATQFLIGMGKAVFTVRTGNPLIHLTSYHILGARVSFDTVMYAEIFRGK